MAPGTQTHSDMTLIRCALHVPKQTRDGGMYLGAVQSGAGNSAPGTHPYPHPFTTTGAHENESQADTEVVLVLPV